MEQMCMGRQFQVDSAETEKVHVEMLLLMPLVWQEHLCCYNVRITMRDGAFNSER